MEAFMTAPFWIAWIVASAEGNAVITSIRAPGERSCTMRSTSSPVMSGMRMSVTSSW